MTDPALLPFGADRGPDGIPSEPLGPRSQLALKVAAVVDATPGARRTGGSGTPVGTQYPGGFIEGIGMEDRAVTVQIVATAVPFLPITENVRSAVLSVLASVGDTRAVDVIVADVDVDHLTGGALP